MGGVLHNSTSNGYLYLLFLIGERIVCKVLHFDRVYTPSHCFMGRYISPCLW